MNTRLSKEAGILRPKLSRLAFIISEIYFCKKELVVPPILLFSLEAHLIKIYENHLPPLTMESG